MADQIIAAFKEDDIEAKGTVSLWKLSEVCRRLGHDDESIAFALNSFREIYGDRGGGIDYKQFVTWICGNDRAREKRILAKKTTSVALKAPGHSWDRLSSKRLGSHTHEAKIADAVFEAAVVTKEGVDLEQDYSHIRELSADECARSFLRFSPALLHHCLYNAEMAEANINAPIVRQFRVALLLIDVSGFTRMSQKLGAELTRKHTSEFFTQIIQCITRHGGDVLKFLGDALLVAWPEQPGAGSGELRDIAVAAAACAAEVMSTLNGYRITDEIILTLHSGLSIGDVYAFDVGNSLRREFLIGGSLLAEIGELEGEAKCGELIMSSRIADLLPSEASLDELETGDVRLNVNCKFQVNTVQNVVSDHLAFQFSLSNVSETRQNQLLNFTKNFEHNFEAHVPPSCREYIRLNELGNLGEMRHVTTMFLALDMLIPYLNTGQAPIVHAAFLVAVEAVKFTGGALRQFVLDDKGCVCICAWGLPRAAWGAEQDACRAIQCALHMFHGLHDSPTFQDALESRAGPRIGIAQGEAYVGLIGDAQRCEYAMVGPSVNLAARLMGKADPWQILVEDTVHSNAECEGAYWSLHAIAPVKAKGYDALVPVFRVEQEERRKIKVKQGNLNDFVELWCQLQLRVQLVGKVASVLAESEIDGGSVSFPMLALVSIVGKLNVANYAETKLAINSLRDSGFIRIPRTAIRGNPICAFTADSVHKWVRSLITAEYCAKVHGMYEDWATCPDRMQPAATSTMTRVSTTSLSGW
jgi:class 3 adenylate cyclase